MKRRRSLMVIVLAIIGVCLLVGAAPTLFDPGDVFLETPSVENIQKNTALAELETLVVKGRAPKTDYSREAFGGDWSVVDGCTTRNIILYRDLVDVIVDDECRVVSGTLHDVYTNTTIAFRREQSSRVQVDHVVALSDAWQKGAQQLSFEEREQLANDPLELIAVDGPANQEKGDGDAATWLPSNKGFRCEYIARQIAVKVKYKLWVTQAEKDAMRRVLATCPHQKTPEK